ncbi:TetR/AcrR family transcriptional regulator [Pseudonocardiaceae bacterium YIM PH 21723]|nr:TetR/AcrR family transcriptional regulator [Pseudonocardiaceae bacterium YIM PH 21723]
MPRPSNTRDRILDVTRELFARKGIRGTSLQEIADELSITKAALYYHFASREDLVRSIVMPVLEDGAASLAAWETRTPLDRRQLLLDYFDFSFRHSQVLLMVITDFAALQELGLIQTALGWQARTAALLAGPEPTLAARVGAVMALGGLQDTMIHFADEPREQLRELVVDTALAILGRHLTE